ncbi:hypothetical protein I3F58_15420 [Streptomyces sp. MUM 203J]|uniref:hypothetical protein n=1 Tax=Streptomyces sp. MUM 203J TaxID=2791990 RepID=UPI001F034CD4|nr:hypothetical protein [Streptomyces sp. MUM 203J]MCH0540934.1 hypothetical protein [Streptomyces sp. MUM 203J]
MLVAAAVCPSPPLLVPDVAAGAAPELADARAACLDALGVLAAARPDRLVVVGPDPAADSAARSAAGSTADPSAGPAAGPGADGSVPAGVLAYPDGAVGGFRGFGVDLEVRLGPGEPDREAGAVPRRALPASLAVAAWLLGRADWADAPVEGIGVPERLDPQRCAAVGREIAGWAPRIALLVMGDGSACRTVKAPGYLDERAAGFDAAAARALGAADAPALAGLDAELAHELKASGRSPWQVLAGAAAGTAPTGRLLYEDAPYGVGYVVATWS